MGTADERAALLAAVCAAPDDDAPRLAYADWCDRRGDPRGEFIRAQVEFAKFGRNERSDAWWHLKSAIGQLLTEHKAEWLAELRDLPIFPANSMAMEMPVFDRGFVSAVTVSADDLISQGSALFAATPIQQVIVRGRHRRAQEILQIDGLKHVLALSLTEAGIDDYTAFRMSECPRLVNLWWLDLSGNDALGWNGVELLIDGPCLRKLTFVLLRGAGANPIDDVDEHGVVIAHPPRQKELELKYGPVRWFHPEERSRPMILPPDQRG